MKRLSLLVVGLVLAATLTWTLGNAAPSDGIGLSRIDANTWLVTGLKPVDAAEHMAGGETTATPDSSTTGSAESVEVSPEPGSRVTLVDADGNFAGIVSGALPDLDPTSTLDGMHVEIGPLSYAVDRVGQSMTLAWDSVVGAVEYRVIANGGQLATTTDQTAEVPLAGLAPGDIVDVEAWGPVEGLTNDDVIATMSLILGDYTVSWAPSLQ